MKRQLAILSTEPLTEFEESMMKMLNGLTECTPRTMVAAVITDADEVVTFYHNATMQDMMVARGFLDLDIQNDNILGNLPYYIEQAKKDGLIEFEDYEEDPDS